MRSARYRLGVALVGLLLPSAALAAPGDTIVLARSGADYVVRRNAVEVYRSSDGTIPIVIAGTAGDDVLVVDYVSGASVPTAGVTFAGGGGSDMVVALGGTVAATTHTFTGTQSGTLAIGARTVAYSGVSKVMDVLAAATRIFAYGGTNDGIVLSDDGVAGDGTSRLTAPTAPTAEFRAPSALLRIDAGAGTDGIDADGLDAVSRPAEVRLIGGTGTDTITVAPLAGVAFTVQGNTPGTPPGDVFVLDYSGGGASLAGGLGTGTISFSTGEGSIAYSGIETPPLPDLSVGLVASPTPGYPASVHTVSVSLVNSAAIGTGDVTVVASVPAGLEILGATPPAGTTVATTATGATWTVPSAPGLQTQTLSVLVRVLSDVPQAPITAQVTAQGATDADSTPGDATGDDAASISLDVDELAALPSNALAMGVTFDAQGRAFAASYGYGAFRSSGTGGWTAINTGLTNPWVWDIQTHPSGAVLAATWGGGLFRTTDAGATWSHVAAVQGAYLRGLALGPDGALYVTGDAVAPLATDSTGTARVWTSTDGGATWTPLAWITRTAIEPWSVAVDPANARTIYVGTRKGLYKSTDGGATWAETGFFGKRADAFAVHVTAAGTVLVGTRDGIVRSTNGGATFSAVASAVPAGSRSRNVYDIGEHPISGRLYVANWGRPGVVVSTNDGASFGDVPLSAAPQVPVERIAIAPDGSLFLMLEGGGVIVEKASSPTSVDRPDGAPAGVSVAVAGAHPVRGATTLRVGLPSAGAARVVLFDALGRSVATLLDGTQGAGWHDVAVDASGLAPGVYVARLSAGAAASSVRLVVAR